MNLACTDYQEKRDFIRMKVDTPISVKLNGNSTVEGICHNLSGGGMLVSLPEILHLGDRLVVTVTSKYDSGPSLRAITTVRRIGEPESQGCKHGLKIEEMIE